MGRGRAAGGGGGAEAAEGRQAAGARAHGKGEPRAGAAGTRAARRALPRRAGSHEEVELPAGAQQAAPRVVALLAVPCIAAATGNVIGRSPSADSAVFDLLLGKRNSFVCSTDDRQYSTVVEHFYRLRLVGV